MRFVIDALAFIGACAIVCYLLSIYYRMTAKPEARKGLRNR